MESLGTTAKMFITFPDQLWIGFLSRKYPYYQIEIKSFIPISQDPFIGNSLVSISGVNPSNLLLEVKDHPSLLSYFVLEETPSQITLNAQTRDQHLLRLIVKNYILIKFPVKIDHGRAEFTISSSRANIDHFYEDLVQHGVPVEMKNIGQYTADIEGRELTPRQHYIYQKARELGYYDTPRKINLSDLATTLDISKSTLSAMLQRIHKKLLGDIGEE